MPGLEAKAKISVVDRLTKPVLRMARTVRQRLGMAFKGLARHVGKATAKMRATLSPLRALGGAAVVGAGVLKLAQSHAQAADDLTKFARRAGLTAQTYSELRFAAEIAGVATGQFDKGIERFNRNIGEAKAGTGALTTLLKKTSPAFLRQLKAVESNEQALDLVIRAMNSFENPAKRAAFAAAVFGRAGQKMTLLTEGGIDALNAQRLKFRELHGEIDGDGLKAAEEYIDAQTRMKASLSGLRFAIGSELLPVLGGLFDDFGVWLKQLRESGTLQDRVKAAIHGFIATVKGMPWGEIIDGLKSVVRGFGELFTAVGGVKGMVIGWVALQATALIPGLLALGGVLFSVTAKVVTFGLAMVNWQAAALFAKTGIMALVGVLKGVLIGAISMVGAAIKGLAAFLLTNPIGIAVALIGAAAALVITHWDKVQPFFERMWDGIVALFRKGWALVKPFVDPLIQAGTALGALISNPADDAADRTGARRITRAERDAMAARTRARGQALGPTIGPASAVAGGAASVNGNIQVEFKDAPAGLRVTRVDSAGSPVDIEANVGMRPGAVGAL